MYVSLSLLFCLLQVVVKWRQLYRRPPLGVMLGNRLCNRVGLWLTHTLRSVIPHFGDKLSILQSNELFAFLDSWIVFVVVLHYERCFHGIPVCSS